MLQKTLYYEGSVLQIFYITRALCYKCFILRGLCVTNILQSDSIWPELLAGTVHCFIADFSLLPLELITNRLHLQVFVLFH